MQSSQTGSGFVPGVDYIIERVLRMTSFQKRPWIDKEVDNPCGTASWLSCWLTSRLDTLMFSCSLHPHQERKWKAQQPISGKVPLEDAVMGKARKTAYVSAIVSSSQRYSAVPFQWVRCVLQHCVVCQRTALPQLALQPTCPSRSSTFAVREQNEFRWSRDVPARLTPVYLMNSVSLSLVSTLWPSFLGIHWHNYVNLEVLW